MLSGLAWLRTLIVFTVVGLTSYWIAHRFLKTDLAIIIAATLAFVSIFLNSKLFRVVLDESIKYPSKSSDLGVSSSWEESMYKDKKHKHSDYKVIDRR
jgi:hypothetical protein